MDIIQNIFGTHSLLIAVCLVVLLQMFSIIVLGYILIRREKTLQLAEFAISPTGVKFLYEIDRDKKVELLVSENILLKKEIEVLKTDKTRLRFTTFLVILIVYLIFIGWKIRNLFRFREDKTELPPPNEIIKSIPEQTIEGASKVIK